jgi:hypothetical protein
MNDSTSCGYPATFFAQRPAGGVSPVERATIQITTAGPWRKTPKSTLRALNSGEPGRIGRRGRQPRVSPHELCTTIVDGGRRDGL